MSEYFKCDVSDEPSTPDNGCDCETCQAYRQARADILSDFSDWSGGFTPDECDQLQLRVFAEHAADYRFSEEEVLTLLRNAQ